MNVQAYIESGVIESYVLGMIDMQDASELQGLSNQYPEIRRDIEKFEYLLEKASFINAIGPPPALKEKLILALQDDFAKEERVIKLNTVASNENYTAPVKTMAPWTRYMAAASVVLLIASAALNYYLYNQIKTSDRKYADLVKENSTVTADNRVYQTKMLDIYNGMQLMSNPSMIKVVMPGIKGKEEDLATVFWDSKTKDVYLLANKLPQVSDDKQYQLWALVDGKPVDAGVLGECNGLCKLKNIQKAQAFAITLEKKGGSIAPDLTQLHVLGKVV